MKILIVSKTDCLAREIKRIAYNRSVTIVETKSPTQAQKHLTDNDDCDLVVISMSCAWGGSSKWDKVIAACGKRQPCVFIPDTCEINAISGVILNNQVVCPMDTPAGKKVFSMLINGIDERSTPKTMDKGSRSTHHQPSSQQIKPYDDANCSPRFTRRQKEVLDLMVVGKSNREIAQELNVAEGTVKLHSLSIYRSLGVSNRVQAVLRGQQLAT